MMGKKNYNRSASAQHLYRLQHPRYILMDLAGKRLQYGVQKGKLGKREARKLREETRARIAALTDERALHLVAFGGEP